MKVRVDEALCVGHGRCYALAPDVFAPDDFGHCVILVEDVEGAACRPGSRRRRELPGTSHHPRTTLSTGADVQDVLGYEGKRVIVTGAASGMGEATASILVDLGAEVHAIDIKKPDLSGLASFTQTDLREPEQIESAVDKIGSVVNMLFNCAGLPNTFSDLDVMLVNFCGLRHVTERVVEHMIEGSAIASIASTAGIGWLQNMGTLMPLILTA